MQGPCGRELARVHARERPQPEPGDRSRHLVAQYYATEGLFEFESRIAEAPATGWVARKFASGKELTMWLVVRDDRGGVTWTDRRVRVR